MLLLNKLIIIFGFVVLCTCSSIIDESPNKRSKPLAIERIQLTDEIRERAAASSLQTIEESAKKVVAAGGNQDAAILCEEGFKDAFKLLASCRKTLNDAFIKAHSVASKDPEAAVKEINAAVQYIVDYIFLASVPVQTVHGAALAKVGELARPGLRTAIELLQHCGVVLFEALNNAQRVATLGIKAGGDASEIALLAGHEIFNTGEEAIYKLLIDSAKSSFEALKTATQKTPVRGFTEGPNAVISDETPEAQLAIDSLNLTFNIIFNTLTDERSIKAIQTIHQGFLSSIFDNAIAIVKAYRAIDGAEKLLGQNPDIAISALHNGMIAVESAILAVSADAILGLGAAGEICNEEVVDALKPAVLSVSQGRVQLFTDLILAEKVAVLGLRSGGLVAEQGLKAARLSVAAASKTLFTHFIDAARRAYNVLQKAY